MKFASIIVLAGLILAGCKKDNVVPFTSSTDNYYQSNGNFLIFVIGDTLEYAYEYNLSTIQLNNDSLQLNSVSVPDETGMNNYYYWKLQTNNDTLFCTHVNGFAFMEEQISSTKLFSYNTSLTFDSTQFQLLASASNIDLEDLWSRISKLDIVRVYRNSLPNAKIGVLKQVLFIYDEQLGFVVPRLKYLLFLAK